MRQSQDKAGGISEAVKLGPSFNLIGRASGAIQPWLGGIGGLGGLRLLAMDARSTDSGA